MDLANYILHVIIPTCTQCLLTSLPHPNFSNNIKHNIKNKPITDKPIILKNAWSQVLSLMTKGQVVVTACWIFQLSKKEEEDLFLAFMILVIPLFLNWTLLSGIHFRAGQWLKMWPHNLVRVLENCYFIMVLSGVSWQLCHRKNNENLIILSCRNCGTSGTKRSCKKRREDKSQRCFSYSSLLQE